MAKAAGLAVLAAARRRGRATRPRRLSSTRCSRRRQRGWSPATCGSTRHDAAVLVTGPNSREDAPPAVARVLVSSSPSRGSSSRPARGRWRSRRARRVSHPGDELSTRQRVCLGWSWSASASSSSTCARRGRIIDELARGPTLEGEEIFRAGRADAGAPSAAGVHHDALPRSRCPSRTRTQDRWLRFFQGGARRRPPARPTSSARGSRARCSPTTPTRLGVTADHLPTLAVERNLVRANGVANGGDLAWS